MKLIRGAVLAATLLAGLMARTPVHAQFVSALPSRTAVATATPTARRSLHSTTLNVYPLAPFLENSARVGVGTTFGGLGAIETAIVPDVNKPSSYALGAWYWSSGKADLYQIHAKYYVSHDWGFQVSYLNSTKTSGSLYDAFVLYNLAQPRPERNYWYYQVGAGPFVDPTGGRTTTDFTGFLEGGTTVAKDLTLNVSYWYVGDRGRFNRFALGLGYTF